MNFSAKKNKEVKIHQDESRPRSPIQTAGCQKPAFSFIFKHLYGFGIVKTALVVLR